MALKKTKTKHLILAGAFVILRTNIKMCPVLHAIENSRSLALQEQLCLVQLKEQLQLLFDSANT
jgi:hypothetical protein